MKLGFVVDGAGWDLSDQDQLMVSFPVGLAEAGQWRAVDRPKSAGQESLFHYRIFGPDFGHDATHASPSESTDEPSRQRERRTATFR